MNSSYYYNDTRLIMLRARRRVFLRRVWVGVGFLALAAASAFVVGLHGGNL